MHGRFSIIGGTCPGGAQSLRLWLCHDCCWNHWTLDKLAFSKLRKNKVFKKIQGRIRKTKLLGETPRSGNISSDSIPYVPQGMCSDSRIIIHSSGLGELLRATDCSALLDRAGRAYEMMTSWFNTPTGIGMVWVHIKYGGKQSALYKCGLVD